MVLQKTLLGGLVLAGAMMIVACAPATKEKDDGPTPFGGTATLDGWTGGPSGSNTFPAENFRLKYVTHGDGHALAYQYGVSANNLLSNLYMDPMPTDDYSGYDQLQFDVKSDTDINFDSVLRGSDAEDGSTQTWQAKDTEWYVGPTNDEYVTKTFSLANFQNMTGWDSNSTFDSAEDFLDDTANNAVWSQFNFLIEMNPGSPVVNSPNTKLVVYIDNVRLHDSTGTNADKVIFDFEPAE